MNTITLKSLSLNSCKITELPRDYQDRLSLNITTLLPDCSTNQGYTDQISFEHFVLSEAPNSKNLYIKDSKDMLNLEHRVLFHTVNLNQDNSSLGNLVKLEKVTPRAMQPGYNVLRLIDAYNLFMNFEDLEKMDLFNYCLTYIKGKRKKQGHFFWEWMEKLPTWLPEGSLILMEHWDTNHQGTLELYKFYNRSLVQVLEKLGLLNYFDYRVAIRCPVETQYVVLGLSHDYISTIGLHVY